MLARIKNRLYADYLMPSRLDEYQCLIETALANDYRHVSVIDFYDALKEDDVETGQKYFVRRHDIDTDVATAKAMFKIEQKLKVKSSFYFRLSTLDIGFMKEIHSFGSEASYHYEEVAEVAKEKGLKSKLDVERNMEYIQQRFETNFTSLRDTLQFPLRSVASHGDFVNRKLGIPNHVLLTPDLKSKLNIEVETYEPLLLNAYNVAMSDIPYPQYFKPINPFDVLKKGERQVVYLLTHPRHWRTSLFVNTIDNVKRAYQGFRYRYL